MMRKFLAIISVLSVMLFIFTHGAECRDKKNLYFMLNEKQEVKTYVSDIADSSGSAKVDLKSLKKILEDALTTRMTINFKLVETKQDADIIISCDVIDYLWINIDPIDRIGAASTLLDVLIVRDYARMRAIFTVLDVTGDKVLWQRELQATLTKKDMNEQDSLPMVNERIVKVFMRECFSKTHAGR